MTAVLPRVRRRLLRWPPKFDPRWVAAGIVIITVASFIGFAGLNKATNQAEDVAAPVAALCKERDVTAERLSGSGACQAAQSVGVGPYTPVAGKDGTNGVNGTNGSDGRDGLSIPGRDGINGANGANGINGTNGADGSTPPCLSEPAQCRGTDGTNGVNGSDGKDGKDGKDGLPGRDGSPAATQTFMTDDGKRFYCTRSGGSDTAPEYACSQTSGGADPTAEPGPSTG